MGISKRSKFQQLRSYSLLQDLDKAIIERLCSCCDVLTVDAGAVIMTAGRRASHCIIIVEGRLLPSASADLLTIDHLQAQAAWRVLPTSIIAETSATLLIIDRRRVDHILDAAPASTRRNHLGVLRRPANIQHLASRPRLS